MSPAPIRPCLAVFFVAWSLTATLPTAHAQAHASGGDEVATFSSESSASQAATADVTGWVGQSAPAVEGVTLADGKPWTLASQRGKVVVFHLWGSWCPVCMQEMLDDKRLEQRVHARHGVVFIGLPINDPPQSARRAVARHAVPWTQVLDSPQHPERGFLARLPGAAAAAPALRAAVLGRGRAGTYPRSEPVVDRNVRLAGPARCSR